MATIYDPNKDYHQMFVEANTVEEKEAALANRGLKEAEMRAAGTWDDSWVSTESLRATLPQKQANTGGGGTSDISGYIDTAYNNVNSKLDTMRQTNKDLANIAYDDQLAQNEIAWRQAQKAMPESQAYQGITGGAAYGANIKTRNAYDANRNSINSERNKTLTNIDLAADEQAINMEMSFLDKVIAQYNADRSYNYQVGRDAIADSRYNTEWNYTVSQNQANTDYSHAQDDYAKALARAQTTGDYSVMKQYGWSDAEVKKANGRADFG